SNDLMSALPQAAAKFLSVAGSLIYVVIIPVLAFFFLKDGHAIRQHIPDALEEGPRRALLDEVMADMDVLMARYTRGATGPSLPSVPKAFAPNRASWMGTPFSVSSIRGALR